MKSYRIPKLFIQYMFMQGYKNMSYMRFDPTIQGNSLRKWHGMVDTQKLFTNSYLNWLKITTEGALVKIDLVEYIKILPHLNSFF